MKKRANIALIIETSGVYGRQILRGVSRYTLSAVSKYTPPFALRGKVENVKVETN